MYAYQPGEKSAALETSMSFFRTTLEVEVSISLMALRCLCPPNDAVDLDNLGEQGRQILQAQHVGTVGGSVVRVGVDLHEQGIAAGGDGGAGQVRHEFTLA